MNCPATWRVKEFVIKTPWLTKRRWSVCCIGGCNWVGNDRAGAPSGLPAAIERRQCQSESRVMKTSSPAKPVERLFPFVLRARILIAGRETLLRSKRRLHFVLIAIDLSEQSRKEVLSDFVHYPV